MIDRLDMKILQTDIRLAETWRKQLGNAARFRSSHPTASLPKLQLSHVQHMPLCGSFRASIDPVRDADTKQN